jgi:hypothetical protein
VRLLTDGKRHLICVPYSVSHLHRMAKELQIARCWFHGGRFPHYDIPKGRIPEITARCELVSSRYLLSFIKEG